MRAIHLQRYATAALTGEPIIEVDNLVKHYKRAESNAVDGISFTVSPGDLFTLLGPNGAGKTTTISILTTTLAPTSGIVRIAGYSIDDAASAVRQQIGIIFQNPSLDLNLTAEENVRLHTFLYKLYPFRPTFSLMPRAYKKQVHELAAMLGIDREIFKPIKTFSGGMKRKLEVVRSLIHQPRVLFLDEPTVGLDPLSRRDLWGYLTKIREERGTTVFLTTHYLEEAEEADTICIINKGKIISYGTPTQVKADLAKNYILIDAKDRESLRSELGQMRVPFTENELFKIDLEEQDVYPLLKSINTPLTVVRTHTPTLEDAYLTIVERS